MQTRLNQGRRMRAATAAASVGRNSYAGSAAGSAYSLASGGAGSGTAYAGAGYVSNGGYGSNGVSSAVAGGANSLDAQYNAITGGANLSGYVAQYNGPFPSTGANPLGSYYAGFSNTASPQVPAFISNAAGTIAYDTAQQSFVGAGLGALPGLVTLDPPLAGSGALTGAGVGAATGFLTGVFDGVVAPAASAAYHAVF